MTNKVYIIKNIKSGYFYTQYSDFEELNFKTKLFPTCKSAERFLTVAKRQQVYRLLEQMYNKHILDIDINKELYRNIEDIVELKVCECCIRESDNEV